MKGKFFCETLLIASKSPNLCVTISGNEMRGDFKNIKCEKDMFSFELNDKKFDFQIEKIFSKKAKGGNFYNLFAKVEEVKKEAKVKKATKAKKTKSKKEDKE